jgi:hypothetical protein
MILERGTFWGGKPLSKVTSGILSPLAIAAAAPEGQGRLLLMVKGGWRFLKVRDTFQRSNKSISMLQLSMIAFPFLGVHESSVRPSIHMLSCAYACA